MRMRVSSLTSHKFHLIICHLRSFVKCNLFTVWNALWRSFPKLRWPQISDIDDDQLYVEIKSFSNLLPIPNQNSESKNSNIFNYLNCICKNEVQCIFPNLYCLLRIVLTTPITVASGERSFSKLKIIKNYLRSSMTQMRLVSLAVLSIENDIVQNTSFEEKIATLAAKYVIE